MAIGGCCGQVSMGVWGHVLPEFFEASESGSEAF